MKIPPPSIDLKDVKVMIDLVAFYKPKVIVEIGTHLGGSANMFMQAFGPEIMVTIEKGEKSQQAYEVKGGSYYYLWERDSHDEVTRTMVLDIIGDRKIDLLFLDGDHSYTSVVKDFEMYGQHVKDNGLIVFHDILYTYDACQVSRLWREIKREFDYVEINCGEASTGLGIMFNQGKYEKKIWI